MAFSLVEARYQAQAERACASQTHPGLFIAGWIQEGGLAQRLGVGRAWLLAQIVDGQLGSIAYVSNYGVVMPILKENADAEALADLSRENPDSFRILVGDRDQVGLLYEGLRPLGFSARVVREQVGYLVDREGFRPAKDPLRLARASTKQVDQLAGASRAMAREEIGEDPGDRYPRMFKKKVFERVLRGRDFVFLEDGCLAFKANVACIGPLGGQIEGVYTDPAFRGSGLGLRGTSAVTEWVLKRSPRAFLLVDGKNRTARTLYEKLGYAPCATSGTIFLENAADHLDK